ncbi:MAG: M28 family peptidase, partial [Gemmatimonadota bacterium]
VPDEFMGRLRSFLASGRTVLGAPPETTVPVVYLLHSRIPTELAELIAGGPGATGWRATLRTTASIETGSAPNTIGVLDGSDPELADEYVVFTAHMDHLGVASDAEAGADSIFNGADDDGSGTVTIVELAEAFASLETRPRRSLVFMTVSGEERGLLGSRWYSENPVVPLDRTVANLNIDMIGRNWADTIVAIGQEESTLGPLVQSVSEAHPELNMAVIDDRWPEENFYSRSDHYNFARKGVPILFFFNGVHEDYHAVTDEVDEINYEKMSRIGRLIFYTGLAVAEADERPVWDADAYARVVEDAAAGEGGDDGGDGGEQNGEQADSR